jgi:hypothetical protein
MAEELRQAQQKSPAGCWPAGLLVIKKSGDTYSRTFGTTIGSESLTTVFGMGTGVTFRIWSPEEVDAAGRRAPTWYSNGCSNWHLLLVTLWKTRYISSSSLFVTLNPALSKRR